MPRYFETHCHLDYLKEKSPEEFFKVFREASVEKVVTISVSQANMDSVFKDCTENYDQYKAWGVEVFGTQGLHPHEASSYNDEIENKMIARAGHSQIVAIGEIGLDYFYDKSPREIQRKVFERQLELCVRFQKPVVVHSRDAEEDTMAILKNFGQHLQGGVIHSFSSKPVLLEFALSENFYIGFNGMVTFKKATNVHEAVQMAPIGRIVLETDSPFLAPIPHRGRENNPSYLPFIGNEILKLKSLGPEALDVFYENSLKLFKLNSY